jgi:DNA-binding MarR family transcriptional regulator
MKSKEILVQLIEYLSAYENECENSEIKMTINDFISFLNLKFQPESTKRDEISGGRDEWRNEFSNLNSNSTDISILVAVMYRYAKGYVKKAMKDSLMKTADEFSFLITLLTYESMTKIELINSQIMEKTSGNEIINRLIKLGLVTQETDSEDKRSIRIRISPLGRAELFKILPKMQMVSEIVAGNLNENERFALSFILRKLDRFHNEIFQTKRKFDLEELIAEK